MTGSPGMWYRVDYNTDTPLITAALCKVDKHPTLLGDVFVEATARVVFDDGRKTDLCRAHLDMLFDHADDQPALEPARVRWFQPIRERVSS